MGRLSIIRIARPAPAQEKKKATKLAKQGDGDKAGGADAGGGDDGSESSGEEQPELD